MVVVLVMFGVGLLLPMAGRMKARTSVVQCVNNARQLVHAAQLYAEDNNDLWPANGTSDQATFTVTPPRNYVPRLWVESRELSNITFQEQADAMVSEKFSLLARYLPNKKVLLCPEDREPRVIGNQRIWRTRSFGLNQFVGWTPDRITPVTFHGEPNSTSEVFRKTGTTRKPGDIFVFGELHPYSICYPAFGTHPRWTSEGEPTGANLSFHVPSNRHGRGTVFSMADGHAEVRRWRFAGFNNPRNALGQPRPESDPFWHNHDTALPGATSAQVVADFKWLTVHTTVRK